MMRWITPIVLVVATGAIWQYNATHGSSQLVFPGAWMLPGAEHDLVAQGEWSWRVVAFVALITSVTAAIEQVRIWNRRDEPPPQA